MNGEETADGCRVTQSWTDLRPGFIKPISALASGVSDRGSYANAEMAATLEAMAATAESTAPA